MRNMSEIEEMSFWMKEASLIIRYWAKGKNSFNSEPIFNLYDK